LTPANFEDFPTVFGRDSLEIYRTGVLHGAGVSVIERVVPVRNGPSWSRDPAAGTTARSVATGLAHRPFLRPTTAVPVYVSGHRAWRVRAVLRDGAAVRAMKGAALAAPLFTNPSGSRVGISPDLPGEITVVSSPHGHGVLIIWSWTTSGRTAVLAGNRAMVAGLTFP
jgi:hypothetical protein